MAAFCMLAHSPLFAQYKYSKKDLILIQTYRVKAKAASYARGKFFEQIYDKYKDTSMNEAIRAYTSIANIEGPENSLDSRRAAFRLGEIYTNAKGTPRNIPHALAYYYISGNLGKKKLDAAKKRFSGTDSVVYASPSSDSLVLAYHPMLGLKNKQTLSELGKLVALQRDNPGYVLYVALEKPRTFYSAIYAYWITQHAPSLFRSILADKYGIAHERVQLLNEGSFVEGPNGYRATLFLKPGMGGNGAH
jgi:hypothetical protein